MANANKNKGKSWERDLARHLSTVFGVNFQRIPNSGAFIGGFNAPRINVMTPEQILLASGDIIVPMQLSHLSLECKFYQDFQFDSLFTECLQLDKWIKQAEEGSAGKIPLVVFKINRCGGFVVYPKKLHNHLEVDNVMKYKDNYVVKMEGFFEKNKDRLLNLKNVTL